MPPHILLLHGALGSSSQFEPLMPLLSDHLTVHTLDFEGHGASPLKDRPLRFRHFAENVLEDLDRLHIDSVHIFGHSMGGHIGLYLARFFPDRVQSIFTLGTKLTWTPEIAERENMMLDPEKMQAKVPHFVRTLQQRHTAAPWERLAEKFRELHLHLGRHNSLAEEDLGRIEHRVRIGLGDRDQMAGLDESVRAFRSLANGELQIFPATPHPLEKVSKRRLAEAIIDFCTVA